ncbi:cupin domain-containing protein [Dokdonia sinensis]|uniref:Cupin domain-containing protein n=1 Tax=Dokdonia sinensis TaxID=2479847 RepID=A0A3M0GL44_9FLAO|nr:cupin domain-containing protein [Dokdonia sinensis]RMB63382.1 cupin domain-containing protein [Dokdonia sinensis]
MKPINIKEKFSKFDKQWHPHQIATVDDMQVILAKISGEFVWHSHKDEDELFYVQKGVLEIRFRESGNPKNQWSETVNEGEIIVVPKGVEHCPTTQEGEEVHLLLFEKLNTAHTGDVKHEKTQSEYPKI